MKANLYFGLAAAALAITLQAAPAMAWGTQNPGGGPGRFGNNQGWRGVENGFGSRAPVTLPGDRRPPAGKSMGILVTKAPSNVLTNAQPKYFRPR
jgi:hypothetical protein